MTNEEAIKLLSQIRDALLASNSWLPSTKNPIKESFGMAINALTAQPERRPMLYRDRVMLAKNFEEWARENHVIDCPEAVICYLDIIGLIQPERKTGRWEIYVISMLDGEGCKCSEYGFEGVPYWDFCPNCGARMEDNNEGD